MTDQTPEPAPSEPVPMPVTPATKPEIKQVSNWIGTAAIAAAGFLVSNQSVVVALVPPPWNTVAGIVCGALGAGLIAYREKQKATS